PKKKELVFSNLPSGSFVFVSSKKNKTLSKISVISKNYVLMKRRKILRVLMMFLVLLNATMVFAVSDKIPVPPDQTNEETCNLENLSFSSQAAIDAFGVTYSGCTEITLSGDLTIGFSNDIINLDGLSNLTSVGGNFYIEQASNLTNLVGLNNLTSVGGFLQIRENPNLINLNGLNSLTTVGGYLAIG